MLFAAAMRSQSISVCQSPINNTVQGRQERFSQFGQTVLDPWRDFHSIDSAQKDSVPSLQEVAETFVCAPNKRPERQWPLPKARHCPQTFIFGQSGIRQPAFVWSSIQPKPASRMLSMKRLRRSGTHPPGQIRPRWLRHLVRAGLPQQLRCGSRRCCSSAWFGG